MACCLLYRTQDWHMLQPGKAQSCTDLRRQWSWGLLFTVRQAIAVEEEGVLVKTLWAYYLARALWKAIFVSSASKSLFCFVFFGWREAQRDFHPAGHEQVPSLWWPRIAVCDRNRDFSSRPAWWDSFLRNDGSASCLHSHCIQDS